MHSSTRTTGTEETNDCSFKRPQVLLIQSIPELVRRQALELALPMLTADSPSCRIWLVRHGQTDYNRRGIPQGQLDIPLDECGIEQAVLCGKRLKDVKLDFILSSDLLRAYKTAENISAHHPKLAIERDTQLRETHRGDRQGLRKEEYKRLKAEGKVQNHGEGIRRFCERISHWWNDSVLDRFLGPGSAERQKATDILVVSHGAFIWCLCDILEREGILENPNGFNLEHGIYNASVTLLHVYEDGTVMLALYADVKHLTSKVEELEVNNADLDSLSPLPLKR